MEVAGKPWFLTRHENIFFYVPNIIGYLRILCAVYAFAVARKSPLKCVISYLIGFICDEFDGRFARKYNQTSQLGAVLDMVTDRLSTAGLFVILCLLYEECFVVFLGLLMLDIFSHWTQMYYTLTCGNTTHKDVKSKSWLVRTYYKYRWFMGVCCVSCEVLYLSLYLLHWEGPRNAPLIEMKALKLLGERFEFPGLHASGALSLTLCIAALALPGTIAKQIINVVQLRNALNGLVDFELKSRKSQ